VARFSRTKIQQFLVRGRQAETKAERGRALEDLICYVFETVPGIGITERNIIDTFHSEEIDVAFWNDKSKQGFPFLPQILLDLACQKSRYSLV
jgi:hypothetical protein